MTPTFEPKLPYWLKFQDGNLIDKRHMHIEIYADDILPAVLALILEADMKGPETLKQEYQKGIGDHSIWDFGIAVHLTNLQQALKAKGKA